MPGQEMKALRDQNLQKSTFEESADLVAKLGTKILPSEYLKLRRVFCQLNLTKVNEEKEQAGFAKVTLGGAEGIRTPYLFNAIQSLSQLSYSPMTIFYNLWVWFYHPYAGVSAAFDVNVSSSPSTSTTTVSPSLNSPLRT